MEKLKIKIENQLQDVERLYDYYLEKYDENPDGSYFERRLDELRVEKRTLENIIDMIEELITKELKGEDKE